MTIVFSLDKSGSMVGLENASKMYNKEQIKELIEAHSDWTFMYIGADIDS